MLALSVKLEGLLKVAREVADIPPSLVIIIVNKMILCAYFHFRPDNSNFYQNVFSCAVFHFVIMILYSLMVFRKIIKIIFCAGLDDEIIFLTKGNDK